MRRIEINSITAFMLCLAIVLSTALPVLADTPPSPPQPAAKASEKAQCSGEFVISVKSGTGWKEAGKLVYGMFLDEKTLNLSCILLETGPAALKITQEGWEAAHLDSVFLGGCTPERVNCNDEFLKAELSKKDLDLTNIDLEGI